MTTSISLPKEQGRDEGDAAQSSGPGSTLVSPRDGEDTAAIRIAEDKHAKLLSRGWCWIKAADLRWGEWVHLPFFHLQVQTVEGHGKTIYVKFFADDLPVRWWPRNYRLRVNYPRADFQPLQPTPQP